MQCHLPTSLLMPYSCHHFRTFTTHFRQIILTLSCTKICQSRSTGSLNCSSSRFIGLRTALHTLLYHSHSRTRANWTSHSLTRATRVSTCFICTYFILSFVFFHSLTEHVIGTFIKVTFSCTSLALSLCYWSGAHSQTFVSQPL